MTTLKSFPFCFKSTSLARRCVVCLALLLGACGEMAVAQQPADKVRPRLNQPPAAAATEPPSAPSPVAEVTPEQTATTDPGVVPSSALSSGIAPADFQYRIGPGDVLDVRVYNRAQLSVENARVENHGVIVLPFIGEVQAACRTTSELAEEIKTRFLKYQRNPQVYVSVKAHNSQEVAVIGAVNQPLRFQLQRRVRLLELLARVNGPSPRAGRSIQILHADTPTSMCENPSSTTSINKDAPIDLVSYNLRDTLKGIEQANPYVRPGDIITVSEAEQIFVIGSVNRPGPIGLQEPITVSRAVVEAGGTRPNSDTGKIRIIRQPPGSTTKTTINVDLKKVNKNQAEDVALLANDIIEVPGESGFRQALRETFRNVVPTLANIPMVVLY